MRRAAVLDDLGTGRRAARALKARGVEAFTLARPGDPVPEGRRIELPSFSPDDVLAALRQEGADSLWLMMHSPARRQEVAAACAAQGIAVIGPDPEKLAHAAALRTVSAGA